MIMCSGAFTTATEKSKKNKNFQTKNVKFEQIPMHSSVTEWLKVTAGDFRPNLTDSQKNRHF